MNAGNSNEFIEFMLKVIYEAVNEMILDDNKNTTQEKIIELIEKKNYKSIVKK